MAAFIVRRGIAGLLTLFVIATLCFAVTRIAPGSPFSSERALHPEIIKNFEAYYGLDQPVIVQYARTMGRYLRAAFIGARTIALGLTPSRCRTCRIVIERDDAYCAACGTPLLTGG